MQFFFAGADCFVLLFDKYCINRTDRACVCRLDFPLLFQKRCIYESLAFIYFFLSHRQACFSGETNFCENAVYKEQ